MLSTSGSSRAVSNESRQRLASAPAPLVQCNIVRRTGSRGRTEGYDHILIVAQCRQPVMRGEPHHAAPARSHSFVQCNIVQLYRPSGGVRLTTPELVAQCWQPVVRGEPPHAAQRARTASCSETSFCCPGRHGGRALAIRTAAPTMAATHSTTAIRLPSEQSIAGVFALVLSTALPLAGIVNVGGFSAAGASGTSRSVRSRGPSGPSVSRRLIGSPPRNSTGWRHSRPFALTTASYCPAGTAAYPVISPYPAGSPAPSARPCRGLPAPDRRIPLHWQRAATARRSRAWGRSAARPVRVALGAGWIRPRKTVRA